MMHNMPDMAASPRLALASDVDTGAHYDRTHPSSSHNRLFELDTPIPGNALMVERFRGRESMSTLFHFEVDCLSTLDNLDLTCLLNQEISLRLRLADGNWRALHGIVSQGIQLGSDGAYTRYRLLMVPWMHRLTQRRDCYVFQDKDVLEMITDILEDYPGAKYRFDVKTDLPKRSLTIQYRESDFDFICRLLAEEGLNFYFEHDGEPRKAPESNPTGAQSTNKAMHQFVVFDDVALLSPGIDRAIRINRATATESDDTITHFAQRHQIQSNAVTLSAWDYKALHAIYADDNAPTQSNVPQLEVYEGAGAYRYMNEEESRRIAAARTQTLEFAHHVHFAESSVRALAVGTWFSLDDLQDSPSDINREYTVLSIEHSGANNLFAGMPEITGMASAEAGTYRNRFTCSSRKVQIRPPYWKPKPIAPGTQVALVVGVSGEEITTERDHRIKVQFPWQRGDAAASGQGRHPAASNAPNNETAGTWVRVAEPAAGANWGAAFIPRIGQEVQIDFIGGDIDRPVVIAQIYNGADAPAFHGGDNHSGALTGFKSKEYAGIAYNQWVMDDTPNQLRQTFATTTPATQFNIGYLIKQDGNQRGSYRGSGLELKTDAWSILRAKQGMFVTSAARANGTSTQLDTQEAQGKLKAGQDLSKALSDAANQQQAAPLTTPQGLKQLNETIQGKQSADGNDAPIFKEPAVLIDSEAAINLATPATSLTFAGQDITQTSHGAHRTTAGEVISISAGKAASLFTHEGGAKVIAGNSPVSFQAHTGEMDIVSDQAMTISSSNGKIKIMAKDEILLNGGQSFIQLKGTDITIGAPGTVDVKGSSHDFMGAASGGANLTVLPTGSLKDPTNWVALHYVNQATGETIDGAEYEIHFKGGPVMRGTLDQNGKARHDDVPNKPVTKVVYKPRSPNKEKPADPLEKLLES